MIVVDGCGRILIFQKKKKKKRCGVKLPILYPTVHPPCHHCAASRTAHFINNPSATKNGISHVDHARHAVLYEALYPCKSHKSATGVQSQG